MIKNLISCGGECHFDNDRATTSIGRNGSYTCKGVDVYNATKYLSITGITSKGNGASGQLCIPKEDIPEFIELLKTFI